MVFVTFLAKDTDDDYRRKYSRMLVARSLQNACMTVLAGFNPKLFIHVETRVECYAVTLLNHAMRNHVEKAACRWRHLTHQFVVENPKRELQEVCRYFVLKIFIYRSIIIDSLWARFALRNNHDTSSRKRRKIKIKCTKFGCRVMSICSVMSI